MLCPFCCLEGETGYSKHLSCQGARPKFFDGGQELNGVGERKEEKRVFRRALVMRFVVDQNVALEKARSVLSKSAGSAVYPPALGKEMLGPR